MKRRQFNSLLCTAGLVAALGAPGLEAAFGPQGHARELYLGPASHLEGSSAVIFNPAAGTQLGSAQGGSLVGPSWSGHASVFRISETASYSYLSGLYSTSWGTAGASFGYLGYDSIGLINSSGNSAGTLQPFEAGGAGHYASPVLFQTFTLGTNVKTIQTDFGDNSRTDMYLDAGLRAMHKFFGQPVFLGAAVTNISPSDTATLPLTLLINSHTELTKVFDPALSLQSGPAFRYNADGQADTFWNVELTYGVGPAAFFTGGRYALTGDLPPLALGAGGRYQRGPWTGSLAMAIQSNPVYGSDVMLSGQFEYQMAAQPARPPTKRELWLTTDQFDWLQEAMEFINERQADGQPALTSFEALVKAMEDEGHDLPIFSDGKPVYLPEGPSLIFLANPGKLDWTDKPHTCSVSDGTQISGRIKSVDDDRITVTSSFGDIDIPRNRILKISDSRLRDPTE